MESRTISRLGKRAKAKINLIEVPRETVLRSSVSLARQCVRVCVCVLCAKLSQKYTRKRKGERDRKQGRRRTAGVEISENRAATSVTSTRLYESGTRGSFSRAEARRANERAHKASASFVSGSVRLTAARFDVNREDGRAGDPRSATQQQLERLDLVARVRGKIDRRFNERS